MKIQTPLTIATAIALAALIAACTAGERQAVPLGASATPNAGGGEPACDILPADNPWNTDVSAYQVHPNSDAIVDNIGRSTHLHPDFGTVWAGAPIGIPYVIVDGDQPQVPVSFYYDDESDPGPYPIPPDAPIEGGPDSTGDRHVIIIDDDNCLLYETYDSHPVNGGESWDAGSGAIFDLSSNDLRPDYWTSADAAGLPIFPGLARYEEVVEQGVLDHALRFTVSVSRKAFIHPATHYASSDTDPLRPAMGMRVRMKASYDCSWAGAEVQVICAGLKKYGMIVADNGANWYVSGAPDSRWDDDALGDLKDITGNAFEVLCTGPAITQSGTEADPCGATPTPAPTAAPSGTPAATPTSPPATVTPTPTPTPLVIGPTQTPTATPHGTETVTPTGPTPTPRPTPTATPTGQTPSVPTPTPTDNPPPIVLTWGDDDCSGEVESVDALKKLRALAGMVYGQAQPCPGIGDALPTSVAGQTWGDTDCDSGVDSVDALAVLRFVAGFEVSQAPGCPDVGDAVDIGAA